MIAILVNLVTDLIISTLVLYKLEILAHFSSGVFLSLGVLAQFTLWAFLSLGVLAF